MKNPTRFLLTLLLIIIAVSAVACAENDDPPPATLEPTAAVESAAPEPTPTTQPAPAENDHDHTPTAGIPPAPTAAPATQPAAAPAPQSTGERLGLLRFRDAGGELQGDGESASLIRAASFQLLLPGVEPPPAGSHYELWLHDDSFNTLNLGPFDPASGEHSGAAAEDLLGAYSAAFISIEASDQDDGKIGPLAFSGLIPAESLLHIRHVVTAFDANPDRKAFLIGAEEQLLLALEHTGFMHEELAAGDLREARRHAEHVVNILDGANGPNFGDLDGDTIAQNPGDGVGVRAYVEGAQQHAQLAMNANGATAEVQLHGDHVLISGDNMLQWIAEAIAESLRVIASDSPAEAQPGADALARLLELTYAGQDVDGDGAIAPISGEGGWQTAYEHALNMGSFEFFSANPVSASQQSAPPAEGAAPDAEEETAAPPPPVTIDIAGFAFNPGDISVPAGTAVTWVNNDSARHSATAADGSFDTGLFDAGQQVTITLDTPGTYIYYCLLHGSPDGSGMAATITVTE